MSLNDSFILFSTKKFQIKIKLELRSLSIDPIKYQSYFFINVKSRIIRIVSNLISQ